MRGEWITKQTGRRARIYDLTPAGRKQLAAEESRWQEVSAAVNRVLRMARYQAPDVARRVTAEIFGMLVVGSLAGLAAGIASGRFLETLLYQVRVTDLTIMVLPVLTLFAAALLAALPPVIHAVRMDPAAALHAE